MVSVFFSLVQTLFRAVAFSFGYIFARTPRQEPAVEQYPDVISAKTKEEYFPKAKGFLDNNLETCNGCGDCLRHCTVRALEMEAQLNADGSVDVRSFSVDLSRCYSCGICVDICPVESLKFTNKFEMSVAAQEDLLIKTLVSGNTLSGHRSNRRELSKLRSYEVRR